MSKFCNRTSNRGKLDNAKGAVLSQCMPTVDQEDSLTPHFDAIRKEIDQVISIKATREIKALELLNTGLKTKVNSFENENKSVRCQLEACRSQIQDQCMQIKTLQTENNALESAILDMTAEVKHLQDQTKGYVVVPSEVVTLKALVTHIQRDCDAWRAENETLRTSNTLLLRNQASSDAELDVDELTAKNRRLQVENTRLQAFLASAVAKEEKLNQSNRSTYELNNQLMDENAKLNSQVREFDQRLDALQEELDLKNRKLKRLEQQAPAAAVVTMASVVGDTLPAACSVERILSDDFLGTTPATSVPIARTPTTFYQSTEVSRTGTSHTSPAVVEPVEVEPMVKVADHRESAKRWRDRYRQSVAPETALQSPTRTAAEALATDNVYGQCGTQDTLPQIISDGEIVECDDATQSANDGSREIAMDRGRSADSESDSDGVSGEPNDDASSCSGDEHDPSRASSEASSDDEGEPVAIRSSSTHVRSVVLQPPSCAASSGIVLQDQVWTASTPGVFPTPLYPDDYQYSLNSGMQEGDGNFYKVVVSNVPRYTTSRTIEDIARNCGTLISTQPLSNGTEFLLEFVKARNAKHAVSQLDGYLLNGENLQCRKYDESAPLVPTMPVAAVKPPSCTVYVRFNGGKEDVRREVERCGAVTSISYQRTHDWFLVDFEEPGSALLALQLLHDFTVGNKIMTCYASRGEALQTPVSEPAAAFHSAQEVVLSDPVLVESVSKQAQKRAELVARNESAVRRDRQFQLADTYRYREPPRAVGSGAHRVISGGRDYLNSGARDRGRPAVATGSNRALKRCATDASLEWPAQPVDLAGGIPPLSSKRK